MGRAAFLGAALIALLAFAPQPQAKVIWEIPEAYRPCPPGSAPRPGIARGTLISPWDGGLALAIVDAGAGRVIRSTPRIGEIVSGVASSGDEAWVVVRQATHSLVRVDPATGIVDIVTRLDREPGEFLNWVGGRLLLELGSELVALGADGSVAWRVPLSDPVVAVEHGTRIYVLGGRDLLAIDPGSGEVEWRLERGGSALGVGDRRIYVASQGEVRVLSPDDGSTLQSFELSPSDIPPPGEIWTGLGSALVGTRWGLLWITPGLGASREDVGAQLVFQPSVVEGAVVVPTVEGVLLRPLRDLEVDLGTVGPAPASELVISPVERRVYYLDTNGSLVALEIPPLAVLNASLTGADTLRIDVTAANLLDEEVALRAEAVLDDGTVSTSLEVGSLPAGRVRSLSADLPRGEGVRRVRIVAEAVGTSWTLADLEVSPEATTGAGLSKVELSIEGPSRLTVGDEANLRVRVRSDSPGEFELRIAGASPSLMELSHPGGGWVEAGVVSVSAEAPGNLTVRVVAVAGGEEVASASREISVTRGPVIEAVAPNPISATPGRQVNLTVRVVNRVASGAAIVIRATSDLLSSPVEASTAPMLAGASQEIKLPLRFSASGEGELRVEAVVGGEVLESASVQVRVLGHPQPAGGSKRDIVLIIVPAALAAAAALAALARVRTRAAAPESPKMGFGPGEIPSIEDVLLHVVHRCPGGITAFRLQKLIYLIDLDLTRRLGSGLGLDWTTTTGLPFSDRVKETLETLIRTGKVRIGSEGEEVLEAAPGTQPPSLPKPVAEYLDAFVERYCRMSPKEFLKVLRSAVKFAEESGTF